MCWFVALGTALGANAASAAAVGAAASTSVASLAGSAMSAYSQYQSGKYNQKVAETNAEISNRAAADALQRGADNAAMVRERTRQIAATQRAGAAAGGVAVDTGSPLDLLTETAGMGELDAQTTLNNAQRQAYGFETQAMNSRAQGRLARSQGNTGSFGTVLTGFSSSFANARAGGVFGKGK